MSSIVLSRQSGLHRGFDAYSDAFDAGEDDARFLNTIQKRGDGPTAEAIAWLEKEAPSGARLFAWLHLYDPHDPYEPPEPYASRYADRPYDGEVAYADELVGRLDARPRRASACATTRCSSSPPTTARGSASTARRSTDTSSTRRRCACRSSCAAPASRAGTRVPGTAHTIDVLPTVQALLGPRAARAARTGATWRRAARRARRRPRRRPTRRA